MCVYDVGDPHGFGTVDQAEGDIGIGFVAKYRLAHQQFVKIGVDQRPNNRVYLPLVIIDAGGDVDHVEAPIV
jgi:hypothetical protein